MKLLAANAAMYHPTGTLRRTSSTARASMAPNANAPRHPYAGLTVPSVSGIVIRAPAPAPTQKDPLMARQVKYHRGFIENAVSTVPIR